MGEIDLPLLRIIGLKGMADEAVIAGAVRTDDWAVRLQAAIGAGDLRKLPRGYALTPAARTGVAEALARERAAIDPVGVAGLYERFCGLNGGFKQLMHDWQIRTVAGAEVPNDHADAAYDAAIVARLETIDAAVQPLLAEIIALVPRLAVYPARFADALAGLKGGDRAMMARPLIDSYHTVWFELHEDLIALSGTTRAVEAAAGRGD